MFGACGAERPSDVALFLRRSSASRSPLIGVGSIAALVFGLWLVIEQDAYELFRLLDHRRARPLGVDGRAGRRRRQAPGAGDAAAERLAAAGRHTDAESRALLRDRRGNAMSWLAGAHAARCILIDMIWKPGA